VRESQTRCSPEASPKHRGGDEAERQRAPKRSDPKGDAQKRKTYPKYYCTVIKSSLTNHSRINLVGKVHKKIQKIIAILEPILPEVLFQLPPGSFLKYTLLILPTPLASQETSKRVSELVLISVRFS